MNDNDFTKPQHVSEQQWLQQLRTLASVGRQTGEGYAEHLARVTQDADHSKALLQAHYRALHAAAGEDPSLPQPAKD